MNTNNEPDLFDIDPHRLPEEWVQQPRLYRQYADKLADARKELEEAKAVCEIAEADIDKMVRSTPSEFGLEKVTEASVQGAVILSQRVQRAKTKVIDARHKVGVLEAAVSTLDHRKRALEKLVDLHLADIRAEPRESKFAKDHREDAADRALGQKRSKK